MFYHICFITLSIQFSSVQSLSRVQLFVTPWTSAHQVSLSITNSWSSPRLTSIESVLPSNHLILCRPLLLLPSIFPSIRVFSDESALHIRWPKYWSFSFSIIPSKEHPGLISFRMDWLDLLAVQGTLKSLLQHHSSKASILWGSAFFIVQLSHPYMTTGKIIALTRQTLVGKVRQYTALTYSFSYLEPVCCSMCSSNCCFLTCTQMFFWNSLAFLTIHWMLAIWSLVPLPFLKPAWTFEVHNSCAVEAWLGEFWALLF